MTSATFKSLLALCRVSNLPTVWINVLAAALLSGASFAEPQTVSAVLLLALALSCFYCGGMALNDVCDFAYDSVHQPFRPIPAGRLKLEQAWTTTGLLFVAGMSGLLLAPNPSGVGAGVLLLAVIAAYDYFHKAWPGTVFMMALARMLVYVVVALALTGTVTAALWLAAGIQALYVLGLTVVARAEAHVPHGRYRWPLIPWLIAAMPLVDGAILAAWVDLRWFAAGVLGCAATRLGQRYVRGD
jgi:4-hydroxybenzoate polyprenyltransferase